MIVKMKKLTLLVSERERQKLLLKLRRLGVVHIKNVSKPSVDKMDSLEVNIAQVERAVSILTRYRPKEAQDKTALKSADIPDNINRIISLEVEREGIVERLEDVESKIEWFGPWGGFNPQDIQAFEEKKIFIRLYRVPKGDFKKKIGAKENIHIIKEEHGNVYIARISRERDERLPFDEIKLPKESYETLRNKRESFKIRIGEIENELRDKSKMIDSLKEDLFALKNRHTFLDVMYGMKEEKGFLYLQGFAPVDKVKDIVSLAKTQGFGYLIEDPDEPENTPTLIRNPKWVSIINPVFKFMNIIPGYNEYDISFWFLAFFSLFFAILIGDAGYGLLFVGLTFLARRKLKKAPREPFWLMYLLSFATIIWGAVSGTWFGLQKITEIPFFNSMVIEGVSSFVDTNQNFMIYICFVIGVIHLSIAHLIIAFRIVNSLKVLAELGWISTLWGLFFTAGTLVLEKPFPEFAGYLLMGGTVLLLFFSNPRKNIIKGALVTLGHLPIRIISSFSDVVSYLRLFAVGYASVVLASTFNNMALEIGFNNIITTLGSALIIVFGHTLNILLGFMAVIVHGIRLNMLEFSGQMGMEWLGKKYQPFKEGG